MQMDSSCMHYWFLLRKPHIPVLHLAGIGRCNDISWCADEEYISWWGSKISVCSVDSNTLQPVACEDYDPRTWKECEWSKGFEGEGALGRLWLG